MLFPLKNLFIPFLSLFLLAACQSSQTDRDLNKAPAQWNNQKETITEQTTHTNSINKEPSFQEKKGSTFTATVVKVIDGDTIKIQLPNGNEETVRLLLIDTPETVHPSKPVQPFGPEASKYTKSLMKAGSKVEVEPGISERDKYGRLLAYIYVDHKMVNKLLLEKGLARIAYVYAPNTKYIDEFEALQKQALKKEIGIWSIENYASPRGFNVSEKETSNQKEQTMVTKKCTHPTIKGNINSRGEKIYHLPTGQFYAVTHAEVMFCTENEAQAAGFRKSQR